MKVSVFGLAASLGCISLCAIFMFWNPYSSTPAGKDTIIIIFSMLVLPAILGIVTSFFNNRILMYIVLVWSVPYGLYLTVVSIPSIFNLFGVVLILYLFSASEMKKITTT
jgi:hypothetical protein